VRPGPFRRRCAPAARDGDAGSPALRRTPRTRAAAAMQAPEPAARARTARRSRSWPPVHPRVRVKPRLTTMRSYARLPVKRLVPTKSGESVSQPPDVGGVHDSPVADVEALVEIVESAEGGIPLDGGQEVRPRRRDRDPRRPRGRQPIAERRVPDDGPRQGNGNREAEVERHQIDAQVCRTDRKAECRVRLARDSADARCPPVPVNSTGAPRYSRPSLSTPMPPRRTTILPPSLTAIT